MYPREVFDPLSYSLLSAALLAGIGYFILLPPTSLTLVPVNVEPVNESPRTKRRDNDEMARIAVVEAYEQAMRPP